MTQDNHGVRRRSPPPRCSLFVTLVAVLTTFSAYASPMAEEIDSLEMVRAADFVFRGVVTAIDYRWSTVEGKEDVRLPHTFVTFRVLERFKGSSSQDTITLRFVGGRGDGARFLHVSNVPLFDVGNEDVLFVRKNGEWGSPLVRGRAGRIRLVGDEVYDDEAREMYLDDKGVFQYGQRHELEALTAHRVSRTTIREVHVDPGNEAGRPRAVRTLRGTRLAKVSIRKALRDVVGRAEQPAALAALPPARSVDPDVKFVVKKTTAERAALILNPPAALAAESAADALEREAFVRNGGNPVLGAPKR